MPLQFSPEAERIMGELPGVHAELEATEAALRTTEQELRGLAGQEADLVSAHETAIAGLARTHARSVFNTYDRRLQKAMSLVATDAEDPFDIPPPEVCEQVAQLDELVQVAAGQPIIVTKPGESWFDFGVLAQADRPEQTGLQIAYEHVKAERIVELPLNHVPLAVDSETGQEPKDSKSRHGELMRRTFRRPDSGEQLRPAINPLNTRVVASDVMPMAEGNATLTEMTIADIMKAIRETEEVDPDQETTYILVGFTAVQQVFNAILGFEYNAEDPGENFFQFRQASLVEQRFQELGIAFDADTMDGMLSYRIASWERHAEEVTTSFYERTLLQALKSKRDRLLEAGLISN